MAKSNAAENPVPEQARGPETAESTEEVSKGDQEQSRELKIEGRQPGQKIEILRPDGSPFELTSLGGDAVAHPSDKGPRGRVMPEREIKARGEAQKEYARLQSAFDSALGSTAVILNLEGAQKKAWMEGMAARKNDMLLLVVSEGNPEAAIIEHLKQDVSAQTEKAHTVLGMEAQLREARTAADGAKSDSEYQNAIDRVHALESQILEAKKTANPDVDETQVLDAIQGFADLRMEQLHAQGGDAVRARIKEVENAMRELDKTLDKNPNDVAALASWKLYDQERQRHGAMLPAIDKKARMKAIETRMREIDAGKPTNAAQAEYKQIDAERQQLMGEVAVLNIPGLAVEAKSPSETTEDVPELPESAMEEFDPRSEGAYNMLSEMFRNASKAEIANLLVDSIKFTQDPRTSELARGVHKAFLADARDGKLEWSPTMEMNEAGEITVEDGQEVPTIPELPDENIQPLEEGPELEMDEAGNITKEAGIEVIEPGSEGVAKELDLTLEQLRELKSNFEKVKAFAKESQDESLESLLDFDWNDFLNAPTEPLPVKGGWNKIKAFFAPTHSPREQMWDKMAKAYERFASGSSKIPAHMKARQDALRADLQKSENVWHVKM